ncbi:MAG: hypothetical protein K2L67_00230 [Clostridia bacterium]|nr:hypothetical protein [Clostridia bacterium]
MNKKKKIAMAVVSTVMAGAMLVPLAACGGGDDPGPGPGGDGVQSYGVRKSELTAQPDYNGTGVIENGVMVKEAGSKTPVYPVGTTLNMNVCDQDKADRQISYTSGQISGTAIMPDNYTYTGGDLKPAWWQMGQTLGVNFVNVATGLSSENQITTMVTNKKDAEYQIITGSGAAITQNYTHFLNLNDYLDYMPNYKAFLEENEIVKWSLTSDTTTGAMYYAPYFDGNNDIEKYVLTHREWTRAMLDATDVSAATTTWAQSKTDKSDVGANQTYVTPFMGTTGSYSVDTTDPANPTSKTLVKVKVNYDAALTAAKNENTALGGAIKAAAGKVYDGESGNIVDLQNFAINEKAGAVTGAQLINILRAYIDAAYQNAAGEKFYAKRSDVFNSTYAAWDVDLLVGLSRCVVTSYKLFGGKVASEASNKQIYAISGRQGFSQRRQDLVSFVGELYGVRGLESRNEYLYIDKDGNLQDARKKTDMWDALEKFNALTKEGLIYTGESNADKVYSSAKTILAFMLHDYAQTQSTDGFDAQGIPGLTNSNIIAEGDLKFDFAPILTPVSKWDEDESGVIEEDEYFRFTESWRAVKNTGFAVPKAAVTDAKVLSATLTFIDYLFSNDGQIVATYGPMSTNGNATGDEPANGFWYATEDTNKTVQEVGDNYNGKSKQYHVKDEYKGQYFIFNNKVYTGTLFGDRQIPTLTTNNLNYFYGLQVNGNYLGEGNVGVKIGYKLDHARKYTDYDRGIVGGALPIGNKDQGFEFQATAACALDGTQVVSTARDNGAIKHLVQEVKDKTNAPEYAKNTYWYTCVPTTLPFTDDNDASTLKGHKKLTGDDTTAGLFRNSSKTNFRTNLCIDILFYGYGAKKNVAGFEDYGTSLPANAAACIQLAVDYSLNTRVKIFVDGWNALKTLYNV